MNDKNLIRIFKQFILSTTLLLMLNLQAAEPASDSPTRIQIPPIVVMSFNVQNYFNGRVSRGQISFKHGRGPKSQSAYELKKNAVVKYIKHFQPDILALQEVENDTRYPKPAILELKRNLGQDYKLLEFERSLTANQTPYGNDAITQFILYKPNAQFKAVGAAKSFSWSKSGAGRPTVLQKFALDSNRTFCIANSHLKSKLNTCGQDQHCTQKRLKQAKAFNQALKREREYCGVILWVGDFNSEPHQQTMRYLANAQWQSLLEPTTYSYIFRGQKMLLDHALWYPKGLNTFDFRGFVAHTPQPPSDHFPVFVEIR